MKLTDQDLMPFGRHEGESMDKVPADYLLWLWDEAGVWNRNSVTCENTDVKGRSRPDEHTNKRLAVHDYIRDNFNALETECPDRIIQHRP